MPKLPSTRALITIALVVLFLFFLIALLVLTNLSFSVWAQLQQKPDWVMAAYVLGILLVSLLFGRFIWHLLVPKAKVSKKSKKLSGAAADSLEVAAQRLEKFSQTVASQSASEQRLSGQSTFQPGSVPFHDKSSLSAKHSYSEHSGSKSSGKKSSDLINPDPQGFDSNDLALEQWAQAFQSSPDVLALKSELQEYGRRKAQQSVYIALFGEISSGKSSLIKALTASRSNLSDEPALSQIETSVIGGTTREVCHYHWDWLDGDQLRHYILTDMPGVNEQFAELDMMATEEVQRAHMVVYLCDGDLTATQWQELNALLQVHKPCIVAVNKSDRYTQEEQQLIVANIRQRLEAKHAEVAIVAISAGAMREFIRVTPDGQEESIQRAIAPQLMALQDAILALQQHHGDEQLERLREQSVASMVNARLDDLEARFRHSRSRRLVNSYTKKAVVASLATISPGTDLLVQGYLGIQMVKDLCQLYEVSARDIDANKLIELIQSRMDKTLPLLLAIAGNGLKAFPGIGTVTGGLVHAVAYGLIFDTLGRSVARTLEVTGELSPKLISDLYKEQLSENVESRTKDFIKMVLKLRSSD